MVTTSDFIGRGWSFPLRLDGFGSFVLFGGEQELDEVIRLILGIAYGERLMCSEYGCGIHDFVFDIVDAGLAGRVAVEVWASLICWELRVEVVDVDVSLDLDQSYVLWIGVTYRVKAINDRRNLVFPFYSIPEE